MVLGDCYVSTRTYATSEQGQHGLSPACVPLACTLLSPRHLPSSPPIRLRPVAVVWLASPPHWRARRVNEQWDTLSPEDVLITVENKEFTDV